MLRVALCPSIKSTIRPILCELNDSINNIAMSGVTHNGGNETTLDFTIDMIYVHSHTLTHFHKHKHLFICLYVHHWNFLHFFLLLLALVVICSQCLNGKCTFNTRNFLMQTRMMNHNYP